MSYYDQEGNPISGHEWAQMYGDISKRTIARINIGRFLISTVWLGLSYQYGDGLLFFETMIFDEDKNNQDIGCQRYTTKEEAIAGHEDAKRWIQKTDGQTGYWPE